MKFPYVGFQIIITLSIFNSSYLKQTGQENESPVYFLEQQVNGYSTETVEYVSRGIFTKDGIIDSMLTRDSSSNEEGNKIKEDNEHIQIQSQSTYLKVVSKMVFIMLVLVLYD